MHTDEPGQCYICGDPREHMHQQHHIVPQRMNGSDKDANIVILCAGCHYALERIYDNQFYHRLSNRLHLNQSLVEHAWEVMQYTNSGGVDEDKEGVIEELELYTFAEPEIERLEGRGPTVCGWEDTDRPDEISEREFKRLSTSDKIEYIHYNQDRLPAEDIDRTLTRLYSRHMADEEHPPIALEDI